MGGIHNGRSAAQGIWRKNLSDQPPDRVCLRHKNVFGYKVYSPSGGSVGIGFAVPVDTAKRIIPDLLSYGKVQRGWIDITPVQIFPELVRYADLQVTQGILVSEVAQGSPAERAGLRGGDTQVRHGRSLIRLGGEDAAARLRHHVDLIGWVTLGIAILVGAWLWLSNGSS